MFSSPASIPPVGSRAVSDIVTECSPRTACSAGTRPAPSQPERVSPGAATRSMTRPSGSRSVSAASPSRSTGRSASTCSSVRCRCHHPSDSGGTLNAVAVVRPAPLRPAGTPCQGKNVRIVDGRPVVSP